MPRPSPLSQRRRPWLLTSVLPASPPPSLPAPVHRAHRLSLALGAKDADRTSIRVANSLELVGNLELLQAPGLPYTLPRQYVDRPLLTGASRGRPAAGGSRGRHLSPN